MPGRSHEPPLSIRSFDAAVSLVVLVHFPRGTETAAFAELSRVLRPGGLHLLRVPPWRCYEVATPSTPANASASHTRDSSPLPPPPASGRSAAPTPIRFCFGGLVQVSRIGDGVSQPAIERHNACASIGSASCSMHPLAFEGAAIGVDINFSMGSVALVRRHEDIVGSARRLGRRRRSFSGSIIPL